MANQLQELLELWHQQKHGREWVLGTIFRTSGPCYRKAGAMMLFDSLGKHYGLLSGGCLESDIQRHAQRVLQTAQSATLCYDGSDEDDFAFQLGIGCGGTVHILLQPVLPQTDYLHLDQLRAHLLRREGCIYRQKIAVDGETASAIVIPTAGRLPAKATLITDNDGEWLQTPAAPVPHVLLIGAGIDARPMAELCRSQGWQVSLCDARPANGRAAYFPGCTLHHCAPCELAEVADLRQFDAAVLMSHNLQMDADALELLTRQPLPSLRYLGLLGPASRRDRVLELVGMELADVNRHTRLHAPIGLDLGGELPESIALATCAEMHAVLFDASARGLTREDPIAASPSLVAASG